MGGQEPLGVQRTALSSEIPLPTCLYHLHLRGLPNIITQHHSQGGSDNRRLFSQQFWGWKV